ncbi:hypothetical protein EKN56_14970 [Limnobaculum zhutongyuii]|uniref:HPt domain-containing protein n=1 Tax=Limnobaculum zhutongyuii TaxID=2498113 RepID=A0A411WN40_9GAMM|nr:Hpt domain-containing protein [Limnobaculum zhutongyuii]QBH97588.1 hypothetical protein EKN56_14970 [Limnobaculum zhutongyuii]TQS91063.1 hypothetical protein ELQ32_01690 [Limnobaculum zhutongyuii]
MNDCLFKPINLKGLMEKLATLITTSPESESEAEPVTFNVASLPAALQQPEVLAEFITTLQQCLTEDAAALTAEAERETLNVENIAALAHKLAGSAHLVHDAGLAQACQQLRQQCDREGIARVQQHIASLQMQLRTTNG